MACPSSPTTTLLLHAPPYSPRGHTVHEPPMVLPESVWHAPISGLEYCTQVRSSLLMQKHVIFMYAQSPACQRPLRGTLPRRHVSLDHAPMEAPSRSVPA